MNTFLYYDPDRFSCVRIPTQIQSNITIKIQTATCTPPFTQVWVYFSLSLSKIRSTTFARGSPKRSKTGFLTAIKIKETIFRSLCVLLGETDEQNRQCSPLQFDFRTKSSFFGEQFSSGEFLSKTGGNLSRSLSVVEDHDAVRRAWKGKCTGQHQVSAWCARAWCAAF